MTPGEVHHRLDRVGVALLAILTLGGGSLTAQADTLPTPRIAVMIQYLSWRAAVAGPDQVVEICDPALLSEMRASDSTWRARLEPAASIVVIHGNCWEDRVRAAPRRQLVSIVSVTFDDTVAVLTASVRLGDHAQSERAHFIWSGGSYPITTIVIDTFSGEAPPIPAEWLGRP